MRAAGATVVFDEALLPESFARLVDAVNTGRWGAEGNEAFLRDYGPAAYHSGAEYATAVGSPFPRGFRAAPPPPLASDPEAEATLWDPQRKARAAYDAAFAQFQLDGLVYPAIQMPPFDEVAVVLKGRASQGPHSNTAWINPIGMPAVSLPGGFYANGLPFGIELSAKRWQDGDLLGYAFAYEQATHHRKPPVLVEKR